MIWPSKKCDKKTVRLARRLWFSYWAYIKTVPTGGNEIGKVALHNLERNEVRKFSREFCEDTRGKWWRARGAVINSLENFTTRVRQRFCELTETFCFHRGQSMVLPRQKGGLVMAQIFLREVTKKLVFSEKHLTPNRTPLQPRCTKGWRGVTCLQKR